MKTTKLQQQIKTVEAKLGNKFLFKMGKEYVFRVGGAPYNETMTLAQIRRLAA